MNRIATIIGLCACVGCSSVSWTRIKTTHGESADWFAASRGDSVLAVERWDGGVRIRSNGTYVKRITSDDPALYSDFVVYVGQEFQTAPDWHASARLVVQSIDDDGITLKYESSFDCSSFGKDTIARDVGQVRWLYTDKK